MGTAATATWYVAAAAASRSLLTSPCATRRTKWQPVWGSTRNSMFRSSPVCARSVLDNNDLGIVTGVEESGRFQVSGTVGGTRCRRNGLWAGEQPANWEEVHRCHILDSRFDR